MELKLFASLFSLLLVQVFCDEFHFDPDSQDSKIHLQEDLDGHIDKKVDEMNADELQFHYFRQHDYDGNERLDGIEIMSKLYKTDAYREKKDGGNGLIDEFLSKTIDSYFSSVDSNNDGYIDFPEYVKNKPISR